MYKQQLNDNKSVDHGQVKLQVVPAKNKSVNDKNDIGKALLCGGRGQFHTNEFDPDKPDKKLTAYEPITFDYICKVVDEPSTYSKPQAQWVIFSTLLSRNFKAQEDKGEFWFLWVDIDEDAQPVHLVKKHLISVIGKCQFEIYTTSSATEENQKSRILVPLNAPLNGTDWVLFQEALNDCLKALGVIPDRAAERPAQLCYLPNKGTFYKSLSNRDDNLFNPGKRFSSAIAEKKLAIVAAEQETQKRREVAAKRKADLLYTGGTSKNLIGAFKETYTVEDILLQAGYKQRGNTFCHPNSSSGSYAASVKDGRVNSLNGTDPLNVGNGAHDAFSAFCVLFHEGDKKAALIDAGNEWVKIAGEPWNKVNRSEYKKQEAKPNKSTTKPFIGDVPKNHAVKFKHVKELNNGETKILATRENLEVLMKYKNIGVAYDVIKKRPVITNVKSLRGEEENSVIARLKSECALHGLAKSVVDEQLMTIMHDNAWNPVTRWLSNIQRTKNHNPIDDLVDALPVGNKEWAKVAFYRWFIQCVAAADTSQRSANKNALPKYESVLTFYGSQGLLKTAFIRALLPLNIKDYLKDGVQLDLNKPDSKTEALSAWLTELGELDSTFKKSDISALKAFLSRQEDEIRKPYARAASIMPRQTSFFASVNEEKFLRDGTGNRRYFPIVVNAQLIIPNDFDCTDLWAFVWGEYIKGEQWWLTREEELLQQCALKNHEDNMFESMVLDEYDFKKPANTNGLMGYDILDVLRIARTSSNRTKLGLALKQLGVQKDGRAYLLPPRRISYTH